MDSNSYLLKTYTNDKLDRKLSAYRLKNGISNVIDTIQKGRRGEIVKFATPWPRVNKMILGGFYPKMNYLIAGASGHGKTFFASLLTDGFLDQKLNPLFAPNTEIIWFSYEMSKEMLIFRDLCGEFGMSLEDLWSVNTPLSELMLETIEKRLPEIVDSRISIVETPMTIGEMTRTLVRARTKFPDSNIIVLLDHTLLTKAYPGQDELEVIAELSKAVVDWKHHLKTCNIFLAQLNDKIESEKRRSPDAPGLHFPIKTDIHGSKQIYHAMDDIFILHQPAMLEIEYYGTSRVPTQDLIALHHIKGRNGGYGWTKLKNNLGKGRIDEWVDTRSTNSPSKKRRGQVRY